MKTGNYVLVLVALLVSLVTLFSMTKIWGEAFWSESANRGQAFQAIVSNREKAVLVFPVVLLMMCTMFLGLNAEPLMSLSNRAAEQLLNSQEYIRVVTEGN